MLRLKKKNNCVYIGTCRSTIIRKIRIIIQSFVKIKQHKYEGSIKRNPASRAAQLSV